MVVLEASAGAGAAAPLLEAAALDHCLDSIYAQGDLSLKVLPKRYIGLHQWVSPLTSSKDLKLQLVSSNYIYRYFIFK